MEFIEQECITLDTPGSKEKDLSIRTAALLNEFSRFCKEKGCNYIDAHKFGEELKKRGFERKEKRIKGERSYYYIGIAIKKDGVNSQL